MNCGILTMVLGIQCLVKYGLMVTMIFWMTMVKKLICKQSKNIFKFGDGKHVFNLQLACIPAKVMINTDILASDLLLLLLFLSK